MANLRRALLTLLAAVALVVPAGAVEVHALRLWPSPENTRVVLDLSGRAQHSVLVLKNPDRIVLDVAGARLAPGWRAPAGIGVVKQVRLGRRSSGELRIVFDLSRPIRPKSFLATPNERYGYRLVLDLGSPAGAAEPAAAETPVRAEHARPEARDLIIAIDAGHGGEDPGRAARRARGERGAGHRARARAIDGEPGMHAVLTRDGDYFVELRDRTVRRANPRPTCSYPFMPIRYAVPRRRHLGLRFVPARRHQRSRRAGWPSAKTR